MKRFLAFDLGAESGRAMLGTLDGGKLALEELHRFPNTPVRVTNGLYWDTFRLFLDIQQGLGEAGRNRRLKIDGIGIDTWGVDFGLLGPDGALVENPRHYRDARNDGMMEKLFAVVPKADVFAATGIQFMQLNSLYQVYAIRLSAEYALKAAARLLFMPDLFNYWLTGVQCTERTIASTSQFYDPAGKRWATKLLERLGIPPVILPEIREPGTRLGPLSQWLAETTELGPAEVFLTGGHDTASAVAAVPAESGDWCYISSGTWSLMGVELDAPIINQKALELNLTNEVGVAGKIRLLKNIAGLWLLQECRRYWAAQGADYSYDQLSRMAEEARPRVALINPDDFLKPGDMPLEIADWCKAHGQAVPQTPGEYARVILESLAERYRQVLASIEALIGRKIKTIHIVGGGSKNRLLNRLVAEATGCRVIAGPGEATAAGNILTQAIGAGAISGLDELRAVVRQSFEIEEVR